MSEGDSLDSLLPVESNTKGSAHSAMNARGLFYVIIVTLIVFFFALAATSSKDTQSRDANGKKRRPSVDKTNYIGILVFSIIIAILIVCLISYWRK